MAHKVQTITGIRVAEHSFMYIGAIFGRQRFFQCFCGAPTVRGIGSGRRSFRRVYGSSEEGESLFVAELSSLAGSLILHRWQRKTTQNRQGFRRWSPDPTGSRRAEKSIIPASTSAPIR